MEKIKWMLCYSATRTIQANTILHNNSSRNISQMPIEDVYIECWTRKESRGMVWEDDNPFKNVLKYTFTSIIGRKLCGLFPRVSFLISWTYICLRAIVHKRVFLDLCLGHGRSRSIMRTTTTQDRSTDFFSFSLLKIIFQVPTALHYSAYIINDNQIVATTNVQYNGGGGSLNRTRAASISNVNRRKRILLDWRIYKILPVEASP